MTNQKHTAAGAHRGFIPKLTLGQWFFCFFGIFSLFLTIRNPEAAIGFVSDGLRLCAGTVIPSLFPFLVVSELLVLSGTGEAIGRLLSGPFRKVFGVSGLGFTVFFLGSLCGFPVGARTAISYFDRGLLGKKETERLLTFTNNPSSAFLISAVGVSLFGSQFFGTALFGVTLLSAVLVGFFGRFILRGDEEDPVFRRAPATQIRTVVGVFTGAVTNATDSMLRVCSYVVFFTALTGTMRLFLDAVQASDVIAAALGGILELTTGVGSAAGLAERHVGAILAAFFSGWAGLSVHMQILSITDGRGLCYRPYFLAKLFQGILAALLMWGTLRLFPGILEESERAVYFPVPDGGDGFGRNLCIVSVTVFLFGIAALILNRRRQRKKMCG